jgi:opacity protein-like surface antigen
MKQRLTICVMAVLAAALMIPPAWSQNMATVKGKCTDAQGKPIAGATVEYANQDSGQKYSLKTNKKGEFFSLGVAPGKYKITLIQNGQVLFYFNGVQVQLGSDENETDFNLQKEQAAAKQRAESQLTPEQKAQQEKVQKENATIKTLNEKLAAARY